MHRIKLLDGTSIPWLGFGSFGDGATNFASGVGLYAVEAGFEHIDTAEGYADGEFGMESRVGELLKKAENDGKRLYVTTKCKCNIFLGEKDDR
jgi:diketogulonate reductase-like aldo/keto reductase